MYLNKMKIMSAFNHNLYLSLKQYLKVIKMLSFMELLLFADFLYLKRCSTHLETSDFESFERFLFLDFFLLFLFEIFFQFFSHFHLEMIVNTPFGVADVQKIFYYVKIIFIVWRIFGCLFYKFFYFSEIVFLIDYGVISIASYVIVFCLFF